jgi:hypothetical protein
MALRGREYRASEEYAAFFESELLLHVERGYRTLGGKHGE